MPKYPNQHFRVFSNIVGTGPLMSVIKVLNDANGTAQKLTTALGALSLAEQQKHQAGLDYVRWTYPGLPTVITNQTLLTALARPGSQDDAVQTALDTLTATEATQCKAGLQLLVDHRPALAYFGVSALTTGFTGQLSATIQNGGLRYTSKAFAASGTLFAITPANARYDVGWVQICTGRSQRHDFAQHKLNSRWEITNSFPINDSSSVQNIPWYHVGIGYGCTHNTAARSVALSGASTYDLNDGFVNNGIGLQQLFKVGNGPKQPSQLTKVTRTQSFIAWLAVTPTATSKYRLLRKVAYEFDFTITVANNNATPADISHNPVVTNPAATDTLPQAAVSQPTMNAGDTLNVYVDNTKKGMQSITVPVV